MSMRFQTEQAMEPAMRLSLECPVCRYHISPREEDSTAPALGVLFLGEDQYSRCVGCGQDVPRHVQSRLYKVRWGRRYRQELCKRLKEGVGGEQTA